MGLGRPTYFLKEWIAQSTLVPRLAARTKPLLLVLGLLLLLLVALVQAQVPADLEVGLLYLVPVATIAWAGGRLPGVSASVAAVGVQLLVDAYGESPPSAPEVPYWNLVLSLAVFVAFSEIMPRLHRALDAERERARTDALTGLGNRRFLEIVARAELGRTRRYHRPFALGYIDVDYFKEVNDRLGHLAGDQLLKLIAREIRRVMRISDVVARMGGDEFALLLPETPAEGAEVAFRKVHRHLSGVVEREGFPVSFSIGVVTCESTVTISLEELLREADEMMYMVKNSGRGSIRLRALREAAAVF